jgi:hypothetical protein
LNNSTSSVSASFTSLVNVGLKCHRISLSFERSVERERGDTWSWGKSFCLGFLVTEVQLGDFHGIVFVAGNEVDLALPFLGDLQDAVAPVVASLGVLDIIDGVVDVSRFTCKFSLTKMLFSALSLLVNFTK